MQFAFPKLCSRCAVPDPLQTWTIERVERTGNVQTTYSIPVPVCTACHTTLHRLTALVDGVAILATLVVIGAFVGLVFSGKDGQNGPILLLVLLGGFSGFVIGPLIAWLSRLTFARITAEGATIRFSNLRCQEAFDQLNADRAV